MHDVVVVGAGPAGCVAATLLARAGIRVLLLDRARFPREKLCGDTVNPGALGLLRRLDLPAAAEGLVVHGMLVCGARGARVTARYPQGLQGRALVRRDFDFALLRAAASAGAEIEEGLLAEAPVLTEPRRAADRSTVCGVSVRAVNGRSYELRSRLIIAADGRASRIARRLGLLEHPRRPRRWAVGAYFSDVSGLTSLGEMHVRASHYIGVAPLPGALANACVVTEDRRRLRDPARLLADVLRQDAELSDRFASARLIARPVALGPLAVDCAAPGVPGLLLAGDAAGFIDPMTGDGLRFAIRGAELAAREALCSLATGEADAYVRLAGARRREFSAKWRFNRALRQLTRSAAAVGVVSCAARLASWPVSRMVSYAADLDAA